MKYLPSYEIVEFIKTFEGLLLVAEPDEVGVPTIGWGTIEYPDGRRVRVGDTCTKDQAQEWLVWEVGQKGIAVNKMTDGLLITQKMFDALVSFAYNLGTDALRGSTLLYKMKENPRDATIYSYKKGADGKPLIKSCEFLRWVYADGKIFNGLVRRRAAEADWYRS